MKSSEARVAEADSNLTPMMRQYLAIKADYPDALVFYRLGDFYELFFDDAIAASALLDLTLTARNKNSEDQVPLCGVPHHSVEGYIQKLMQAGRKIVICDQVEDARFAKGIVKREVTRVITPGTVLDPESLPTRANNFLLTIKSTNEGFAAAICDVSTGLIESFAISPAERLFDEISRSQIREVIFCESDRNHPVLEQVTQNRPTLFFQALPDLRFDQSFARDEALSYYNVSHVSSLGFSNDNDPELAVVGALLTHLKDLKILSEQLLEFPRHRSEGDVLFLDETTLQHLEIFRGAVSQNTTGSLFRHLDLCRTPMGSRRLAAWLGAPLRTPAAIRERQNAVAFWLSEQTQQITLQELLIQIPDLERLANRFALGSANARDATALATGLAASQNLKTLITATKISILDSAQIQLGDFDQLITKIRATLIDEPPLALKDGGIIRDGVNAELDELRDLERTGKDRLLDIEKRERDRTGIGSLKVRFNNVFGYYIEITNTHRDKVPNDYIRKQTLANAERYVTEELKTWEAKILGAGERVRTLEYQIFSELRDLVRLNVSEIKKAAEAIGTVDVTASFAELALKRRYVRPELSEDITLDLRDARHPVLETLDQSDRFVPNDIRLDSRDCRIMIITGPNMAGKSTVMRATALIAILAQIGSFVPCSSATVGMCDRIFTRVGAHDNLQKGLSTFMVEMVETAKILREATAKSLVVLDEIGRGTSTFDGLSIAWAVAEDLHDRVKTRTLFATHYHELCDLAENRKGVKNFHMAIQEWNEKIVFLRKLKTGGTNRSYGVAVAAMAGLPKTAIIRAREILAVLEEQDLGFRDRLEGASQMPLFDGAPSKKTSARDPRETLILDNLRNLDPNSTTPIEALQRLMEWQRTLT